MPGIIERRNLAGDRYAEAVRELWDAYANLAALDRLNGAPSFGTPPETVPLRHPTYLPALAGSITDGVAAAMETQRRIDERARG